MLGKPKTVGLSDFKGVSLVLSHLTKNSDDLQILLLSCNHNITNRSFSVCTGKMTVYLLLHQQDVKVVVMCLYFVHITAGFDELPGPCSHQYCTHICIK